jgi:hypothetical protein
MAISGTIETSIPVATMAKIQDCREVAALKNYVGAIFIRRHAAIAVSLKQCPSLKSKKGSSLISRNAIDLFLPVDLSGTVEFFNLVLGTKVTDQEKRDLVAFLQTL